ncbi:uncharacterized protein PHACADRAFT_115365 [Phanerochaete carnosa HHB-10118-sp]|uniref:EVE domain-containing protein n=1 Tax=Phanerochaete carnosa (strain HHB-10118-sp) TaxID=650164 RepID=K5W7Q9_PHACS|nr:uncharacterized protein PHACADRAFT_115365 [Phanerochaete carnosa HHB-10118-sp]EKM59983.1 hypothetical protein PHACADRAFT_115365 [Phanerochaete carnosa HHB-10118-sp]
MKHWLMKAEPDSRIVKGKDVKFSVDDFEAMNTTPWEGVRNAEARNLMKEMQIGDRVLFYHSNCKNPGIAAFAEVSKQAYPDCTAWDPSHPYYDQKSDKENPKWYMVDLTFNARAKHFVPLSLLKRIAASPPSGPPPDVEFIGEDGMKAIKEMALINRGRLSVQYVEQTTWSVIEELADSGGWEDETVKRGKGAGTNGTKETKRVRPGRAAKAKVHDEREGPAEADTVAGEGSGDQVEEEDVKKSTAATSAGKKRKAEVEQLPDAQPLRRSTRTRK